MSNSKLLLLFSGLLFGCLACNEAAPQDDFDQGVAQVMSHIQHPEISGPHIILSEYCGHQPDRKGTYDFHDAIQSAIDSLSSIGGGHLIFTNTAGMESWIKSTEIYRCVGPIELKSNVALGFDPSTRLHFQFDEKAYLGKDGQGVLRRYEGTMLYSFSPLIYGMNVENVAIYATGRNGATPVINGDGETWLEWQQAGEKSRVDRGLKPAYLALREVNEAATPLKTRIFNDIKEDFYRPQLFSLYFSKNILVEGIKFEESPFWMINPVFCDNLIFKDVALEGNVVNNDGIDPDGCNGVLIENVLFNTHDDNIALKSGRDKEAREGISVEGTEIEGLKNPHIVNGKVGQSKCENVFITNCHFKNHYAICIGSEIAAGAKNVYALDNFALQDIKMGVFLKSNRTRGGVIENVYVKNFRINQVPQGDAICVISNYDNDSTSPYPPMFKNIKIENVTVEKAHRGIRIYGWADAVLENIELKNINIKEIEEPQHALEYNYVNHLTLDNVKISDKTYNFTQDKKVAGLNAPQQE